MSVDDRTVILLGDYDYEYFREVSLREGLESQGVTVKECRYRDEPLFIGVRKLLLLPFFYGVVLRRLWQLSREGDIDAILVTKFNVLMLPAAALAAWWLDAILIYDLFVSLYRTGEMRGYASWKVKVVHWIERITLRLPAYHLTETAEFARLYTDLYSLPRERIVGLPLGADDTWFHPREDSPFDSFTVVYWGNFLPHHGLDTVVGAIDRLRDEDVDFVFLGEGPKLDCIRERIDGLDVSNVEFRGRVPWEELSEAAAGGDVALGIFADDPRSRASITNKVSEGVAAGTAVVTMRSPAIEEWFTDGEDIVLVPPEDPDALADAIRDLRDDPETCDRIARQGRERYESVFSIEHIGELLVEQVPLSRGES
ncbi:glycosyltransferase [Haloarchaeobius litoreus]|uniref:Glycosyltransferase n=1 Tax=Haloarchaeobius litoreus TaxID=755306 RepID=A0ABD6DIH4_9EURY|nr:glycosyltransferase [Haloarchaeobius litoreus]